MRHLVLASSSVFRKQLLEKAGYHVQCIPSNVLEPDLVPFSDLDAGLMHLATLKARAVDRSLAELKISSNEIGQFYILGADTISLVDGQILGKPDSAAMARTMLDKLSGATHSVLTGWCLLRRSDQLAWTGVDRTRITMRKWSSSEIDSYIASDNWIGKCGAYGLEWPNDPYVIDLQGSVSNVIGIPLERLDAIWKEFSLDESSQ